MVEAGGFSLGRKDKTSFKPGSNRNSGGGGGASHRRNNRQGDGEDEADQRAHDGGGAEDADGRLAGERR